MKYSLRKIYLNFLFENNAKEFYKQQINKNPQFSKQIKELQDNNMPIQFFGLAMSMLKNNKSVEDVLKHITDLQSKFVNKPKQGIESQKTKEPKQKINFYDAQIQKYPNLKKDIEFLKTKNFNITNAKWIIEQAVSSNEPIQDIIPVIEEFEKKKELLTKKNIKEYKDKNELVYALQDLNKDNNKEEEKSIHSTNEQKVLTEKDGWFVVMPYTTNSSIKLGKNTTWCTAYTHGGNKFLNYIAREHKNIILFYVINPSLNPRTEPYSKLSIGFVNDKPVFDQGDGSVTVDAANNNLTQQRFEEIVGQENAKHFLDIMIKKSKELEGKHPAKKELEDLINNNDLFFAKINSYKNNQISYKAKKDFLKLVWDRRKTIEIENYVDKFFHDLKERKNIAFTSTDKEILFKLSKDLDAEVRHEIVYNENAPTDALKILSTDEDEGIRSKIASNKNTPPDALNILSTDTNSDVRHEVAWNKNALPDTLKTLSTDTNTDVRFGVSSNISTLPDTLKTLSTDAKEGIRHGVAGNPNTSQDILKALSTDVSMVVRYGVAHNKNTSVDTLVQMYKDNRNDTHICNIITSNLKNRNIDIKNYLQENKKRNIDKLLNFLIE